MPLIMILWYPVLRSRDTESYARVIFSLFIRARQRLWSSFLSRNEEKIVRFMPTFIVVSRACRSCPRQQRSSGHALHHRRQTEIHLEVIYCAAQLWWSSSRGCRLAYSVVCASLCTLAQLISECYYKYRTGSAAFSLLQKSTTSSCIT